MKNKDIIMILVKDPTRKFWVKDSKKIKYYMNLATKQSNIVKGQMSSLQIKKVIYK